MIFKWAARFLIWIKYIKLVNSPDGCKQTSTDGNVKRCVILLPHTVQKCT